MLLIGLTGSIATGKSTVSSRLSKPPYNLPVIDADLLARKVVEPGTSGYNAIVAYFGDTTPDLLVPADQAGGERGKDGKGRPLNRPALGRRVFGNSEERTKARKVLNGIVHPAVRREMYKELLYYYFRGQWAVVLDIPLLFESGLDFMCGTIMVVAVSDPRVQMERLTTRDPHLSAEDASHRVLSQTDVREKAKQAEARGPSKGVVVWNDDGKEELEREIERVMRAIGENNPLWWGRMLWLLPPLAATLGAWNLLQNWLLRRQWEQSKVKEKSQL